MTREEVVKLAESYGWRAWGFMKKLNRFNGSSYQAFRSGNAYMWIGHRFIQRALPAERKGEDVIDFVASKKKKVERIMT